ncbi:sulfurtransferase complex subunit TusD [Alteromonas sp. 345S023]|uniref:Sulfurtransferase complex subunit TusD n=1 Tax=Alteromonas profundi TaxID=2696062 RepID=A0A7X5LKX2_9ALTE|nr:sulfurtransferase complex subunit TusD [Alteromonas profundi]NDV91209.1 sulfurtransferase complex subunit TusD [Alteromonas profundi]
MSKYSILITSDPYEGHEASKAIAFAKRLLTSGHDVENVFFYGRGVLHANDFMLENGDEFFAHKHWVALANDHHVPLLVCVTAAVKRGVVSELEAEENGLPGSNMHAPFEQVGLGAFFTALHKCDKLVQF